MSIRQPIETYVESAYRNYADYVIYERALSFLGDGFKPVARRILCAMWQLALGPNAKYKKSARTIGDVLGKFHPHGDQACYEAMVLMAQPFSMRYPLIDGQGNWGSMDAPKSFAAMRYTEARLSRYAETFLEELNPHVVPWSPNFDATLKEPVFLPSRLPNILLNGAMGIAVGLATDIPPHNLGECVSALRQLLQDPHASDEAIMAPILGPDLPTGGLLITPREELMRSYQAGQGSYRVRACFVEETRALVITALPYQVPMMRLMQQIADLVLKKKLLGIEDIRDESDGECGLRLVLLLKKGHPPLSLLRRQLCAWTDCEKTYKIQQYVLDIDHKPRKMSLPELLRSWLKFRLDVLRRRFAHELEVAQERLHILDGFKMILLSLDEVIEVIRQADDPAEALQARWSLTEVQVRAILEIRLRQLARLECLALEQEYQGKSAEAERLQHLLESPKALHAWLDESLQQDVKVFGDPRRTLLATSEDLDEDSGLEELHPWKVSVSQKDWFWIHQDLQALPSYHEGDAVKWQGIVHPGHYLLLWDQQSVHTVPAERMSLTKGKGVPSSTYLNGQGPMHWVFSAQDQDIFCLFSKKGYGFRIQAVDLKMHWRQGKLMLEEDELLFVAKEAAQPYVALLGRLGNLWVLPLSALPMRRGKSQGVSLLPASTEDVLEQVSLLDEHQHLSFSKQGQEHRLEPQAWKKIIRKRGQKGHLLPRHFRHQAVMTVEGDAS